jgi:hypothetical protein
MKARWIGSSLIAIALMGCGAAATQAPSTTTSQAHACSGVTDLDSQVAAVYAPSAVSKVEALYTKPGVYDEARFPVRAYRPSHHVEGASLYVPAPAHTSPAYLERALSCYAGGAGSSQQLGNDPLRVDGVKDVDVRAVGSALRIDIRAEGREAGERVLEAARVMQSNVGITQLAAGTGAANF